MQETWVQSLGLEDPLEKEMATHSSILAWEISWTEEPGEVQFMGSQGVSHTPMPTFNRGPEVMLVGVTKLMAHNLGKNRSQTFMTVACFSLSVPLSNCSQ